MVPIPRAHRSVAKVAIALILTGIFSMSPHSAPHQHGYESYSPGSTEVAATACLPACLYAIVANLALCQGYTMGENAHKMGFGNDENDENRVEQKQFLLEPAPAVTINFHSLVGKQASKASTINQRRKKERV